MINEVSINLGLTEQQKEQIAPVFKEEVKELQALKKDTSLSALKKIERLKEISGSADAKITPLLNPEQQASSRSCAKIGDGR